MTPDPSNGYPNRKQPHAEAQQRRQSYTGLRYSGMESTTALWSGDTLFRAIFKNASVGIAITDPDGHILQINEVSCRFLGYDPHELVGKHFSEITHPDDVLLDRTLYAALVTGERDRYVIDKRFLRKDGIVVWGRITVSLLQHPDSGERYTIVLCQDIHDRKQAEAEQRRSEAKLRKTQQVAHVGNWEFDPATQEITCSEEILRFCGLDPSQSTLSYETVVRSFLHPDDQAAASQLVERAAMEGMSAVDMRIISPDGSLRYVESRAEAVTDDQGQIIRLVGMARDITQRKELELLLRSQVQKEQGINRVVKTIRNSLDLTTVFLTTTREIGQLSEAERVEIVQYFPEEGLWRNVADYRRRPDLPDATGLEIPDAGNYIAARLKRHEVVRIDDATTVPDEINPQLAQTFPGAWLLIPLVVGTTLWGSLSLVKSTAQAPWQDAEVELVLAIADHLIIAIQQSELYQQVQQLNANLEQQVAARTAQLELAVHYEAICKRISDQVRDFLDEGKILQTAVQELAQALQLESCDTGLYSADRTTSTIYCDYTEHLPSAAGKVVQMRDFLEQFNLLLHGQSVQFCFLSAGFNPIRPEANRHAILACPLMDDQGVLGDLWLFKRGDACFSEAETRLVQQVANQCAIALRQARLYQTAQAQVAELERLNRLKDDFLSTVSHELRAPMANIKMATHMLELVLRPLNGLDARLHRYLQILRDECQRETDLINDLLDLSRLEGEITQLTLTPVDLTAWLPRTVEPFLERMQTHQQHLVVDVPDDLPVVTTELSYLGRVLTELLNNACKYTPANESITLSAWVDAASLHISVRNTGVEISSAEHDRIFDKFYRIPNNDPWKHGGTGLGLALAKKLAERLTATLQVNSSAHQTTFTLQLPIPQIVTD